jgi:hypothetical protein
MIGYDPAGVPVQRAVRLTLSEELNALMTTNPAPEVQATVSRLRATLAEINA